MKKTALDDLTGHFAEDFARTKTEVGATIRDFAPQHDMARIERIFDLVERACDGRLPGYQKLQTLYHNYQHTLEVTLCAARLLHGLALADRQLGAAGVDIAVIGALLHDTGYLKRVSERQGTGAQFTADHVERSAGFARTHLTDCNDAIVVGVVNAILITDHRLPSERLAFASAAERLAAQVAGTADLVAQMASRVYLERLLFLYFEFKEAGLGSYEDVEDILERTSAFYRGVEERLKGPLEDLSPYLAHHFAKARGISRDLYRESIDRNLAYLDKILTRERGERIRMLKRGGIVEHALRHGAP